MKLSRNARKLVALTLSAALVLGGVAVNGSSASAAKKATLKLSKKSAKIAVGKKLTLKVKKKNVKSAKVTWKSSKKAVASVSKKGVVKAKKAGKAKISATIKYKAKGSKKTKKKTLRCTVTVTKKSAVMASKTPVVTKGPDTSIAPTKSPSGNVTAAPTNTPGENVTAAPTNTPGGNATSAPTNTPDTTDSPDATIEPIVSGKWYSGTYTATLSKEGDNEATITSSSLDSNAAVRVKDAINFGTITNSDGKTQPALLVDCSKLVGTGMTTPGLKITANDKCNIMYTNNFATPSWGYKGTSNEYTTAFVAVDGYAVYLGDKNGDIELTVSLLDMKDLPSLTTTNIPADIALKAGSATEVELEYALRSYSYDSEAGRVFVRNADWTETPIADVTFTYDETTKKLTITSPANAQFDLFNTYIEYSRIFKNADGKKHTITQTFHHNDPTQFKSITLESDWTSGWCMKKAISAQSLTDAGLTAENLSGSKIIISFSGVSGSNLSIASGDATDAADPNYDGDKKLFGAWQTDNGPITFELTDKNAVLTDGILIGLSTGSIKSISLYIPSVS